MEKVWSIDLKPIIKGKYLGTLAASAIFFLVIYLFVHFSHDNIVVPVGLMVLIWIWTFVQTILKRFVYSLSANASTGILSLEAINMVMLTKKEDISLADVNTEFIFGRIKKKTSDAFILKVIVQGKVRQQMREGDDGWRKETLEEIHNYIQGLKATA